MLPALGKCCKHQGLVLIIQWTMRDLGAQDSFIFGWIVERVRGEEGREKVGLCLLRAQRYSSSLFVVPGKEVLECGGHLHIFM